MADRYYAEFEEKGEEAVREQLALGVYGEPRAQHARHWLAEKEREKAEKRTAKDTSRARISMWVSVAAAIASILAAAAAWVK